METIPSLIVQLLIITLMVDILIWLSSKLIGQPKKFWFTTKIIRLIRRIIGGIFTDIGRAINGSGPR